MKALATRGIPRALAKKALEIAESQGALTIFALVDALTRLTGQMKCAGDRTQAEQKIAGLLAMAV